MKPVLILGFACVIGAGIYFQYFSTAAENQSQSTAANQNAASAAQNMSRDAASSSQSATFVAPTLSQDAASAMQQGRFVPGGPPQLQLAALKKCYSENSCGFAETDSRSAHFEAVGIITNLLNNLPADLSHREKHQLVREFIAFPDPQVQAAALQLAATLPADSLTVAATIAALRDSSSEENFLMALPILATWKKLGLDSGLDTMLIDTLRVGGVFAAQSVADNILPLLTRDNLSLYRNLLVEMPEGRRKKALRSALSEFENAYKSRG